MFKLKKRYIFFLAIAVAGVVISSLLPPQILKIIIDDNIMEGIGNGLLFLGMLYLGAFIFSGIFDALEGYMLNVIGQKIVHNIRQQMELKLSRLDSRYFTKNSSGTITSKFMNDVENINSLFTDGIVGMIIDCLKIIGIIFSIWMFNFKMGFFSLCLLPVIGVITWIFRKCMLKSQKANLFELGKVNNHITESIKNIIMIKTFSREDYMEQRYDSLLRENYITMNKVNFFDSCYSPIIQVMTAVSTAFILYSFHNFDISIGQLAASINLITNLFSPVDNLGTELQSIQKGISGIESVKKFLSESEEEKKNVKPSNFKTEEIIFDNLSFEYDESTSVFKDFNLVIKPGENIAFVGRTGAGKSTLFKLIIGILKPTKGKILINGIETSHIGNSYKRRIFGYVQQNFSFIKGSVWEQISLGDKDITHERIEQAVEFVGLREYVNALPEGFDTLVGEDSFSQGQKQLMAIARAIVTDPPVLLLDEVTSGLDTVTEERVVDVLKRASKGKTILSIAHRESTINGAERIIRI